MPVKKKQASKKRSDEENVSNQDFSIQNSNNSNNESGRMGNFFSYILVKMIPLGKKASQDLKRLKPFFSVDDIRELSYLLRLRKFKFKEKELSTKKIARNQKILIFESKKPDKKLASRLSYYNDKMFSIGKEVVFTEFSYSAEKELLSLIAPDIVGRDELKLAGLLQLFAKEKVHILLLGDPSTGKTVVLRSVSDLAPISSFGLGSGASKAGLTLTVSGNEVIKGILPQADNGIACIDELNLMKKEDLAGLLNAMEKGFITYDKGNHHLKIDARIKVFASANPTGDKFVGTSLHELKKQIPFDQALLSRFHLIFLLRRPDVKEFMQISEKIISQKVHPEIAKEDLSFAKDYIEYALKKDVSFDESLSETVKDFVEKIRVEEDKFLVEISPRTVVGIINLAKASARMRLSDTVEKKDIELVVNLLKNSLYIKKSEIEKN